MTLRAHLVLAFTLLIGGLATGCVVAGEDEPALDEIAASGPDRGGKFVVHLYKDGKEVSYASLTRRERATVDLAVETIHREADDDEWECENYDNGDWYCTNDLVECLCREDPGYCECWDNPVEE